MDEDIVEELRNRARDYLTTKALANEESLEGAEPDSTLLELEGLDRHLAYELAAQGVRTLEDLAEQGIDDLEAIESLTPEMAGELIMKARNICWFSNEE